MKHTLIPTLLVTFSATAAAQTTYHVPGDIATIAGAIATASDGDTILVAPGIYAESGLNFAGKAIRLASTHGPDVTTIDAQYLNRVFLFTSGETQDSIVEGFRIYRGLPPYTTSRNASNGGGIYIDVSSPTIRDCIIQSCLTRGGNTGSSGGGQGGHGGDGAGIFAYQSNGRIESCRFLNNDCGNGGTGGTGTHGSNGGVGNPPDDGGTGGTGGFGGDGGGLFISGASPLVLNCYFYFNWAGQGGRGGRGGSGGDGITFQSGADGGRGGRGGDGGLGGAILVADGTPTFVHTTIIQNRVQSGGSGGNGGTRGSGGFGAGDGSNGTSGSTGAYGLTGGLHDRKDAVAYNSISYYNDSYEIYAAQVEYSCVQGGYGGIGNISTAPMLAGSALLDGSPCIDAGDDSLTPGGTSWDINGMPRMFDHPLVANGVGGSTVDMGCSEFVAAFALPLGCGNPIGSLELQDGMPAPGATLSFLVSDDTMQLGARAALLVGMTKAAGTCGLPWRGGNLFVDPTKPVKLFLGGSPGNEVIDLVIPSHSMLIGRSLFVQGATVGPLRTVAGSQDPRLPQTLRLLEGAELVVGP